MLIEIDREINESSKEYTEEASYFYRKVRRKAAQVTQAQDNYKLKTATDSIYDRNSRKLII